MYLSGLKFITILCVISQIYPCFKCALLDSLRLSLNHIQPEVSFLCFLNEFYQKRFCISKKKNNRIKCFYSKRSSFLVNARKGILEQLWVLVSNNNSFLKFTHGKPHPKNRLFLSLSLFLSLLLCISTSFWVLRVVTLQSHLDWKVTKVVTLLLTN